MGALEDAETLTALGHHLAILPVDVHLGKMMIYAAIFGVLDPVLTIAATLSYKSPFVSPMGKQEEANIARRSFGKRYGLLQSTCPR